MTEATEPQDLPAGEDDDTLVVDVPEGQDAPAPEPEPAPEPKRKPRFEGLEEGDENYGEKVQKRISQLVQRERAAKAEAARERSAREAAERAAFEVRRSHLTSADASLKAQFEQAQERQKRAFSEGDGDAVAASSAEMAELAARRSEVQREVRQPAPQQPQGQRFTPQTQAFIDENPWFNSDPDAQATAIRAHEIALRRGIRPDTSAYFDHVTKAVRALHPEHFEEPEDEEDEVEQPRKAAIPPVAPARRTVPGVAGRRTIKLPSLSPEQRDMARQFGMTDKEYATELAKDLAAQGKL